jgi:hypothetical protein
MNEDGLEPTGERVALALVIGVACIAGGVYLTSDAYAATLSAEEVDAVVLESSVGAVSGDDREFRVHVTYEYTYDGETHTSDNIYAGAGDNDRFSVRGNAESFLEDYQEGDTVTANVNPDDPSQAHLESGIRVTSLVGYAVLVLVGLVAVAGGLKQWVGLRAAD